MSECGAASHRAHEPKRYTLTSGVPVTSRTIDRACVIDLTAIGVELDISRTRLLHGFLTPSIVFFHLSCNKFCRLP